MKYELIRSRRKTLSVEVSREGKVIVRAPLRLSAARIEQLSPRTRTGSHGPRRASARGWPPIPNRMRRSRPHSSAAPRPNCRPR